LREAARSHPSNHEPLVELVRLFIEQEDFGKARAALADLERRNPEAPAIDDLRRQIQTPRRR